MLATLLLATGCGSQEPSGLAIYDWKAQRASGDTADVTHLACERMACPDPVAKRVHVAGAPKLTSEDVARKTVRAAVDPGSGEPVLVLQVTGAGKTRFEELTRTLARRGLRLNEVQPLLVVIDDTVYSSASIDYRAYPRGPSAEAGIQINMPSIGE